MYVTSERLRALESGSTSREPDFSQWPSGGSVGQKCGFEKFVPCCGPHLIVVDLSTLDITFQQTAAALAPDQPSLVSGKAAVLL